MKLHAATDVQENVSVGGIWLDMQLVIARLGLIVIPNNANRSWLAGKGVQKKASIVRWRKGP